jgi:hypothetical protein
MATYRILYWQEIPSQIAATDEDSEVNLPMSQRFLNRIDEIALSRGMQGADDYLAQWQWSAEEERAGTAQQVAEAVRSELEAQARW